MRDDDFVNLTDIDGYGMLVRASAIGLVRRLGHSRGAAKALIKLVLDPTPVEVQESVDQIAEILKTQAEKRW